MTIDLSDMAFWDSTPEERAAAFHALRAREPVSWQRQPDGVLLPDAEKSGGYWAVLRHEDVRTVSRDPKTYRSGDGVMFEDVPPELLEAALSILGMDDPRHARVRRLIAAGFSPRNMRALEADIVRDARTIVDELEAEGDAVELISKRLPLMTIMRMLGVDDEAERERLAHYADAAVSWNDPDYLDGRQPLMVLGEALGILHAAATELAVARRGAPRDDVMSALATAEIDGGRLTDAEIAAFFVLLCVAGNDTTRHTTSHALVALQRFPDQRALVLDNIDTAVEEFVRWASPVMTFRRTAAAPARLGDMEIEPGQKVVLFYPAANRDPEAFDEPDRFDVRRDPNRHVGFGGGGPHFCLGNALARTQLRVLFGELLSRHPDIEVGEPRYLVGNFVDGVKGLPYRL